MVEVVGQLKNDLVTRIGDREDRVDKSHVGAGSHDNSASIERYVVLGAELMCDCLKQLGYSLDELVLVVGRVGQEFLDTCNRLRGRPVIGYALAQRDRAGIIADQFADHRYDRRLHRLHPETVVH